MRLTTQQTQAINNHVASVYGDANVYLFGSRVDDSARGGDIDLFIESKNNVTLAHKLRLITLLQLSIGNQKIDIIVKTPESKHRAIFDTAKEKGIRLC